MIPARRLLPRTITAQITALVVTAVLLAVGLTTLVLITIFDLNGRGSPEVLAVTRAARIAMLVKEELSPRSQEERALVMAAARWFGIEVERLPLSGLDSDPAAGTNPFVKSIKTILRDSWGIEALADRAPPGRPDAIAVPINGEEALIFQAAHRFSRNFIVLPTIFAVGAIIVITVFLSIYALRWITSPLSSIAAAARSFGRTTAKEEALSENGPREIAQVAEALNDMRKRVRTLVDERTRMLAAISHDLRTPLTRLRLRAERMDDAKTRDGMLQDITTINDMIGETLTYLRDNGRSEPVHLVDLPSMIQTICDEFGDVGFPVAYEGPGRHPFACRAHALTRAITNVIDNGTKHGPGVFVVLSPQPRGAVRIDISDNGPGIPEPLREKVFEPFFKGNSARPSSERGGFGLGLSIARDIVRNHGGDIRLLDHEPRGLTVRLTLPRQAETSLNIT
ncbi:ATP-binding protein [Telmatospirillum siberiense]|uniref:histidine kinase n=1 Tax=Telmatospirillum siberiense TaxID=382514 RepID=A0A2N3Q1T0_9PROT|nr:ATP-binding protein [Telmatospirillum siberiense]PKU26620.1 two-component sensor histidine kinase [Telmatospirillum siberiense]